MKRRPTSTQIESALAVLLWLHENTTYGRDRDDISNVRHLLDEASEAAADDQGSAT